MGRKENIKEWGLKMKHGTYVVAEIGINHGGDIDLAKQLIDSAARAKADAVKFQTYITEKRAPKGNQVVFDILKKCELPFKSFKELKECASQNGIDFFSTPFDEESVECLESIGCETYKIASFDVVNQKLLNRIAKTRKRIFMSVGMATLEEIEAACRVLKKETNRIALLHCISAYPIREEDANLATIYDLKNSFDYPVGYSDHTNDIAVPLFAVAAGAQIIEKHFKIDEAMECIDAPVSITETQMKELVQEICRVERILGEGPHYGVRNVEKATKQFRRVSEI